VICVADICCRAEAGAPPAPRVSFLLPRTSRGKAAPSALSSATRAGSPSQRGSHAAGALYSFACHASPRSLRTRHAVPAARAPRCAADCGAEMVIAILIVVPALLGSMCASGDREDGTSCKSTRPARPLSKFPSIALQVASLKLGVSSVADVISVFGDTSRLPSRESQPETRCYQRDGLFVYFQAGAAGGWTHLTGYGVAHAKRAASDVCADTTKDLSGSWAASMLQADVDQAGVIRRLGKPTCRRPNVMLYVYERREIRTEQGRQVETDRMAMIEYSFIGGRLASVSVHYTMTT